MACVCHRRQLFVLPLVETFVPIRCANDDQFVTTAFDRNECNFDGDWIINYLYVEGQRPCMEDTSRPAAPAGKCATFTVFVVLIFF